MNILFVNAYFKPEVIAFSHLENDLLESFTKAGHEIYVIAPTPTRGISAQERKKYAKVKREELYGGKIQVRRFWAPQERKNSIARALRYLWCNMREYQIAKDYKGIDIVFAVSTPPTQGMLAAIISRRLSKKYHSKVRFIFNLQDLFPESLISTGIAKKDSVTYKIGNKISQYTYNKADTIAVISEDFKKTLISKGVSGKKISVIYNWVDTDAVKHIDVKANKLFDELNLSRNKFYITYAGSLGMNQGTDTIIDTAKLLKDKKDIQFVIFGYGLYFEHYQSLAKSLENIKVFPLQPQNRVSEVYSLGSASIISSKKGVGQSGLPSKTWSIMATSTPVLLSFDSGTELQSIVQGSESGLFSEAEDVYMLAENILYLYGNRSEISRLGMNARRLTEERFSRRECNNNWLELLHQTVQL